MKRCLASACWLPFASRAETLDRIAVTVGRHVISEHDILQDMRISAFIDGKTPVFSADQKRKAAERLVDQYLVLEDATATRVPPPPAAEVAALLTPIKARYASDQAYRARTGPSADQRSGIVGAVVGRSAHAALHRSSFSPGSANIRGSAAGVLRQTGAAADASRPAAAILKNCSPISRPCRRSIAGWRCRAARPRSSITRERSSDTRTPFDGPDPGGRCHPAGDLRRRRRCWSCVADGFAS